MSVHGRLDRLEGALGDGDPPLSREEAERLAGLEAELRIVLHFAKNAKANDRLDEFDTLMEEVDELMGEYGGRVPQSIAGHLNWIRTARPVQLPPAPDWPTEEQLRAADRRLWEMGKSEASEPEGGWGFVDRVVALAALGRQDPAEAATPRERWERLVARRIAPQLGLEEGAAA
jgi:hypothetical protein